MRGPETELPIILEDVSILDRGLTILDRISLKIDPGAPTAVMGPNGAGKSTLLRVAMGLLMPTRGRITWGGRSGTRTGRRAIVFQRPVMLKRTVAANVSFALAAAGAHIGERHRLRDSLLDRVGLLALAGRAARRLSGGEQQRLAIARALARDPEVLLLDEPTNNLDPAATRSVEAIVRDAAASGIKVVMATQDLGQARRLAGDVLFLAGGRLLEQAPAERFFTSPGSAKAAAFLRGDIVE